MTVKTLRDIHIESSGKVSDKWESYLTYYEQEFNVIREEKISLLEIGVQNGGSLENWSKYFQNGEIFVGCDINEDCAKLSYNDDRIHVVVGDINSPEALKNILNLSEYYDVIIDDGSHKSTDIISTFLTYFKYLKPGGSFIIEDTHCLYMKIYGGGLSNEFSAHNFFKKLTDIVNFQWWKQECSIDQYLQTFFNKDIIPSFITDGWVDSVQFRNSIITIKKSLEPSHEKIGKRYISGINYDVHNLSGI